MKKITIDLLVALAALSIGGAAYAAGRGGGPAGVSVGAGAGAGAGASAAGAHVSTAGNANANGQFSSDRQFGLDRAQSRMSEEGLEHEKATSAPARRKGPKAGAEASGEAKAGASSR